MRKLMWTVTLLSVMVGSARGAETEKSAPPTKGTSHRNSPVRTAVRQVKDSIVSIKAYKNSGGATTDVVGTGVIIDERGYIVTNRHVIYGATKIVVKTWDDSEYTATIETTIATHDLAVLKLSSNKKFKALRFGPTSDLEVGESVIAIGSPYGFDKSVSTGIVSRLGRSITMPDGTEIGNLIQHSAPIDPGNSGGPLFNYDGELIGINVALHQKSRAISFALNAEDVQKVLAKQLSSVKLTGLNHGLTCKVEVKETVAERQTVYILDVEERTPAAEAGLKYGDQLVKVGSYEVSNKFDVERAFWDVEGSVTVTVIRKGESVQVKLSCPTQSARRR